MSELPPLPAPRRPRPQPGADPVLSVVAPVFNERETLPHFCERILAVLEGIGHSFELILVDDGSRDGSRELAQALSARDRRIKALAFARNFGHQIAITAGIDFARGQAVVVIDSDLQDPPEVIPRLVAAWQEGNDIVYATRRRREGETAFKLATAALFYRVMRRITSVDIPRDTGDFRLMDRRAVDALKRLREHHRFMRGLSAWIGFRQVGVEYDRRERFAGSTKYPLRKMVKFATDAVTSFSYVPLQFATSIGFFIAGLALLGIVATIVTRLVTGEIAGQATVLVTVLLFSGLQLIFLGVIGEYLGRIYDEVKGRPLYLIDEAHGFLDPPDTAPADRPPGG